MTANCFHPGLVATGFNRNNGLLMNLGMTILKPVSRSPQKGADTLVWLATSPDVANVSGGYFFDQRQRPPSPEAEDTETAGRLWEISERQCAGSGEAPKPAMTRPAKQAAPPSPPPSREALMLSNISRPLSPARQLRPPFHGGSKQGGANIRQTSVASWTGAVVWTLGDVAMSNGPLGHLYDSAHWKRMRTYQLQLHPLAQILRRARAE